MQYWQLGVLRLGTNSPSMMPRLHGLWLLINVAHLLLMMLSMNNNNSAMNHSSFSLVLSDEDLDQVTGGVDVQQTASGTTVTADNGKQCRWDNNDRLVTESCK